MNEIKIIVFCSFALLFVFVSGIFFGKNRNDKSGMESAKKDCERARDKFREQKDSIERIEEREREEARRIAELERIESEDSERFRELQRIFDTVEKRNQI